jgi:hypothetical protein
MEIFVDVVCFLSPKYELGKHGGQRNKCHIASMI